MDKAYNVVIKPLNTVFLTTSFSTYFSRRLSYMVFLTTYFSHLSHNVFITTSSHNVFLTTSLSYLIIKFFFHHHPNNVMFTMPFSQHHSHNVFLTTSFSQSCPNLFLYLCTYDFSYFSQHLSHTVALTYSSTQRSPHNITVYA